MLTDPVSDLLARIRNAALARHEFTNVPHSRLKAAVAQLLKQEGYIADVRTEKIGTQPRETLTIVLKYTKERKAAFRGLKRVSKPGRRVYVRHSEIPPVLSGLGVSILSTSQGLMTDGEARRKRVGGDLLCEVW
jgi:small subunit ribosomal protein S8